MKIYGNRFLVTGGAGFIGSHLVDMILDLGASRVVILDNLVRGTIDNLSTALKDSRARLVQGDLNDPAALAEALDAADGVFHLASLCLAYSQEHPREGYETNVGGTYNVLEKCVEEKVRRLVFASSSSVYGNAQYVPMDESHPFCNRNFYGASKICGEALCRAFFFKYGLPYAALRFMNVYGPRQDYQGAYVAVIMKTIDRIQQGSGPLIHGNGSQTFDFVYVRDACRALCMAMESDVCDDVFNISSGQETSVKDLAEMISSQMHSRTPTEFAGTDDSVLVTRRVGSTEKAAEALGFQAATILREGLARTIEWKTAARSTI